MILGAGPAGLGAAWRLQELGHDSWELFEAESHPGGLSASVVDEHGFVWDLGGHVLHSHYPYLDAVLDEVLPGGWLEHTRAAWIWWGERFVPYPLQQHIRCLPEEDRIACVAGLRRIGRAGRNGPPRDFAQWILRSFGRGLAERFFFPYNRKVWACEPAKLGVQWIAERVAPAEPAEVGQGEPRGPDKTSWGPNAVFRFPRRGGTGAIWNALFLRLAETRRHLGRRAVGIDPTARTVAFADGTQVAYDTLISTIPLDGLLTLLAEPQGLEVAARRLRHSCLHVIGIGLAGATPEAWRAKSWVYFPQPEVPFHRVTVFSNYAPDNVPEPGRQWSLLAEVSEPEGRPGDPAEVARQTVDGLCRTGSLPPGAAILSTFHQRLEHAYPTPLSGRDSALQRILPALERRGIFSRGRFGAWKYEVGNMDHSFMQGVEVVDRLVHGAAEKTLTLRREPSRQGRGAELGGRHG